MARRSRSFLVVLGLVAASLVLSTSVVLAQAVGVIPGSAPPGAEITVFGDGFQPGEEITVFFGGTEVVTFADDNGSFAVVLTIDELMPPGMHPLEVNGDMGSSLDLEYEVEEPPPPTTTTTQSPTTTTQPATTTTQSPTTTTQPATTTTQSPTTTTRSPTTTTEPPTTTTQSVTTTTSAAPATTEGVAPTTVAPVTTEAEPTTSSTSTVPTTVVDDTRVSTTDGGGVPWWLILIAILIALALGAGVMMALNNTTTMKAGEFTDDKGNKWRICAGRACKIEHTRELGNYLAIRTVPRGDECPGDCKCVLFSWPRKGDASPSLEEEDGGWVRKSATKRYRGRCVEKI